MRRTLVCFFLFRILQFCYVFFVIHGRFRNGPEDFKKKQDGDLFWPLRLLNMQQIIPSFGPSER